MNSNYLEYVMVDYIQSHIIGTELQNIILPLKSHPINSDRSIQIWMELLFTSICHQTNWDKLYNKFVLLFTEQPLLFEPKRLINLKHREFINMFGEEFDCNGLRERINTLKLLANFFDNSSINIEDFIPKVVILGGLNGLYERLDKFTPFSVDPLRKKARVFVHQLLSYSLIEVIDSDNILPAIDYHLIRLYIRTGRVIPTQDIRLLKLAEHKVNRIEIQTHIRRAVETAMWYTASGARLRIDKLNHIEWQIARSFCLREEPLCNGPPSLNKRMGSEVSLLSLRVNNRCPNVNQCAAVNFKPLFNAKEPKSAKTFY